MRKFHRQSLIDGLSYECFARLYDPLRRRLSGRVAPPSDRLLVHIPKNAGLAIQDAVCGHNAGHRLFCEIAEQVKRDARQIIFCTRDPFDKLVSSYTYLRRLVRDRSPAVRRLLIRVPDDFAAFVMSEQLEIWAAHHYFFRSQFRYLEGIEKYASKAVHLRFASLQADAREQLGVTVRRMNAGTRAEAQALFDPAAEAELRARVRQVYWVDYEKLPKMLADAGLPAPW